MSAYSDWKCGALSDDEYKDACNREYAGDDEYDSGGPHECEDCAYFTGDGCKYGGCELGSFDFKES